MSVIKMSKQFKDHKPLIFADYFISTSPMSLTNMLKLAELLKRKLAVKIFEY
jgi:hypothetical protein